MQIAAYNFAKMNAISKDLVLVENVNVRLVGQVMTARKRFVLIIAAVMELATRIQKLVSVFQGFQVKIALRHHV